MTLILYCVLLFNLMVGFILYFFMHKKRKLFSERYGMIMAMCISSILGLSLAMLVQFINTLNLSFITFLAIITTGLIGVLFGSLLKFQSLLSGFFHGVIGGIMGTMLGKVILDPTLCSLPATYLNSIEQNIIIFSVFATMLVIFTISLLFYSLRV